MIAFGNYLYGCSIDKVWKTGRSFHTIIRKQR